MGLNNPFITSIKNVKTLYLGAKRELLAMLLNIFSIISWLTKIYDKISYVQKSAATSCWFWQTYIVSATTIWIWNYLRSTRSSKKASYIRSFNLFSLWGILFHFRWSTRGSIKSAYGRLNRFSSNSKFCPLLHQLMIELCSWS